MGYRVHTLSPDNDTPTGQVADVEIVAPYEDLDAVRKFSAGVSVVTFEFENVPSATAEAAGTSAPVRPSGSILHTTQHRLREKSFLAGAGFPLTPFLPVRSNADLHAALESLGRPAILKTADFGYDGKGQALIRPGDDAEAAWQSIGGGEAVLEAFVDFDLELSVVAARGSGGSFAHYGAIENAHSNRILDVSVSPARVPPEVAAEAVRIAHGVLDELRVVGVLCVEFFLTRAGKLLINELAPRPHNSGHLTFDAAVTSQFEQQLRAVCELPLGSSELLRPAAMANLLGDLWRNGEPDWNQVLAFPTAKLHLYGKLAPRPGRKMGHITALAPTPEEAEKIVRAARDVL
jgi:5-(carboxyamino)imidazole ribonucleotide synthase